MGQYDAIPIVVLDVVKDALAVLLIEVVLAWIKHSSIGISLSKSVGNVEDICL